jgi:hypothetical protein
MRLRLLPVAAVILMLAGSLQAHHAWPVSMDKLVTVKGTVVEVSWGNPHPMFALDVPVAGGKIERWSVGGPAINRMENNGWTATTLKVGDVITGSGYQFSDGQKIIRLERLTLPSGKEMKLYAR